jgi:hypothetical protein
VKLLLTLGTLVYLATVAPADCLANEGQDIMQATFRLTDGRTSGTAWLVSIPSESPNPQKTVVVTAAHVFKNLNGETATLVLRKKIEDGSFARLEHKFAIREKARPLWKQHSRFDIGVIQLVLPDDAHVKLIPLNQLTNGESATELIPPAQPCLIPTFPAQMEGNRAGWPVLRNATVASFPNAPVNRHPRFILDFNAFGGDSGAPVILNSQKLNKQTADTNRGLKIVGMILGQHRQTDRTITPNEERTVHTSLGLGIAIHTEFIRETIAQVK